MRPVIIDIEGESIRPRPEYPPKPLGVGIMGLTRRPRWVGWGFPTDNNGTKQEARDLIRAAYRSGRPVVFHHAQFDVDVIEEHFGLRPPANLHCTQVLAFLHDPNFKKLDLKTQAQMHLGMSIDERDELHEWIRANVPEAKRKKKSERLGEFYCRAPGDLVGRYCLMDLHMTAGLFDFFSPVRVEMAEAYAREIALIPVLLDVERSGTPISPRIHKALKLWEGNLEGVDQWLRKRLKTPDLDCDKKEQLADGLEKAGLVDAWVLTDTGRRSVAWENLLAVCNNRMVVNVLHYRSKLANAVRTFGRPWVAQLEKTGGTAHCHWNPTPRPKMGGSTLGARTGRLSSNPNWQNVQTEPIVIATSVAQAKQAARNGRECISLPVAFADPRWALPYLRDYVSPLPGYALLNRDYSQQELRILAHFAGGKLLKMYAEDPFLDFHQAMQMLINRSLNANWGRRPIKAAGFGIIYTMGLELFAEKLGETREKAAVLRTAYKREIEIEEFEKELKWRGKNDEPIWTWGGRRYYVEPPTVIKGRPRSFEYKLLNTLIQGSGADAVKEFMVRYYSEKKREGFVSLLVHDETVAFVEERAALDQMRLMAAVMESLEFDVPMITDGKYSTVSWARAKPNKGEKEWRIASGVVVHPHQKKRRRIAIFDCMHGRIHGTTRTRAAHRKPVTPSSKSAKRAATKACLGANAFTRKLRPS